MSIVSVSRLAGPSHLGHSVFTQSVAAASGEMPFGARSWPRRSGSVTGSCSSGTGTSPQPSQYTIGIGAPQNRCLDTSQSRSRYPTAARPRPLSSSVAVIAAIASDLFIPSNGPELTRVPSPGVACQDGPGSGRSVCTTTRTGRSKARAKSRSRWSCAGTAMIAPVP